MNSTKTSWIVVLVFILVGVAVSTCAHAEPYVIASLGKAHTDRTLDSASQSAAWTQNGFDSIINNKSGVYSLGLGYDWTHGSVETRWHDAGTYSQFGSWRFSDDGRDEGRVSYGYGHVHVTGVSLAVVPHYRLGNFTAGLEAGLFNWRARWTETVVTAGSTTFSTFGEVKDRGVSPIVGMILGYKSVELRYEVLHSEPRDGDFNAIRELNLAYRLPF